MRKHSLLSFTAKRVVYSIFIWKEIVGKFSMFCKEMLSKKGRKEGNLGIRKWKHWLCHWSPMLGTVREPGA